MKDLIEEIESLIVMYEMRDGVPGRFFVRKRESDDKEFIVIFRRSSFNTTSWFVEISRCGWREYVLKESAIWLPERIVTLDELKDFILEMMWGKI